MDKNEKADKRKQLAELLANLKAEYLRDLPKKIQVMKTLAKNNDWEQLQHEYHKLKGTGKTYGFPEVSQICEVLESMAIAGNPHHDLFIQSVDLLEKMHSDYLQNKKIDLKSDPVAKLILKFEVKR